MFPSGISSLPELKKTIEASLKKVWFEHIDPAPARERQLLRFNLICALRFGMDVSLFHTERTMLVEDDRAALNGTGTDLGRFLLDLLLGWSPQPSVEVASQVAAYIIHTVKQHVQFVGHGSDIHILPVMGLGYSVLRTDRQIIEKGFDEMLSAVREMIRCVDSESFPGVSDCIGTVQKAVENLRSHQQSRARRRVARLSESKAKRYPQPPTTDPSGQPPSQE